MVRRARCFNIAFRRFGLLPSLASQLPRFGQLEEVLGRPAGRGSALLPIAHSGNGHPEQLGEGRLRQVESGTDTLDAGGSHALNLLPSRSAVKP